MASNSNYILPLKAPTPLPASGVNIVTFKVWKNTLIAHVQQDVNHHHFMPGGLYSEWTAAENGIRISALHEDDHDRQVIEGKRARTSAEEYARSLANLLTSRNSQLSKFITHIACLCHHTENDDITNSSTSLEWIFDYLIKHYGLQTKGANFLNISEHVFTKGTPFQTFYKHYRAAFLDNLRKQGDVVKFKNNQVLEEDEKLSPSFENAIILWTLEKIDPRLPHKVKRDYGHQMTGDTTLKDIQPLIFENIATMIADLDQNQVTKVFASQLQIDEDPSLNAINSNRNSIRGRTRPFPLKPRGGSRSNPATLGPNRSLRTNSSAAKYCRICHLAGSNSRIYTSHEIGACSRLSIRDLESLKNTLLLNGMLTLDDQNDEEPCCVLQPGWDDIEEQDSQNDSGQE